ncbi:MAG: hypothetical protein V5A43_11995 [Haloarculaceae archaeon]
MLLAQLSVGGAFRLHALVNLALAAILALALVVATRRPAHDRPVAIALGLAAAATTVFVVLAGLVYFQIGPYLLPIVDALSDLLGAA